MDKRVRDAVYLIAKFALDRAKPLVTQSHTVPLGDAEFAYRSRALPTQEVLFIV
jgi:hypothetical protein